MRWLFVGAVTVFTLASIGCATSGSFASLIAWRVIQGFSGGTLIPAVFSAVFLLFPFGRQTIATTIAGVVAVIAPTVGPVVGGWITETYSWHWLFLINVVPGIVAALSRRIRCQRAPRFRSGAPSGYALAGVDDLLTGGAWRSRSRKLRERNWTSPLVVGLLALSLVSGTAFVRRTLHSPWSLVELRYFRDGISQLVVCSALCWASGLFGSVYLMPVFLAYVGGHGALAVGEIVLVTGVAQFRLRRSRSSWSSVRRAISDRNRVSAVRRRPA